MLSILPPEMCGVRSGSSSTFSSKNSAKSRIGTAKFLGLSDAPSAGICSTHLMTKHSERLVTMFERDVSAGSSVMDCDLYVSQDQAPSGAHRFDYSPSAKLSVLKSDDYQTG